MGEHSRLRLAVIGVIAVTLSIVILAPVALSFGSLVDWARDSLGLSGWWPYVVPLSLDAGALLNIALVFHATVHAESAAFPRALVWAFAVGSSIANYRHGVTVSPDAAVFFPAMPLAAALLLEVTLRRVRRSTLVKIGAVELPLARFRAVRWVRFPRQTFAAWSTAIEHGLSSPAEALAVASNVDTLDPAAIAHAVETRELDALPSSAARVRRAAEITGEDDPVTVAAWLAERGHAVSAEAARSALRRRPVDDRSAVGRDDRNAGHPRSDVATVRSLTGRGNANGDGKDLDG